jgi:hypothetical protein
LPEPLYAIATDSSMPKTNGSSRTEDGNPHYFTRGRVSALIGLSATLAIMIFHPENLVTVILFFTAVCGLLAACVFEALGS